MDGGRHAGGLEDRFPRVKVGGIPTGSHRKWEFDHVLSITQDWPSTSLATGLLVTM